MKILFLAEGDPETHDSWSGVSRSLIQHLREAGHTVHAGDVDLYGLTRLRVAARTVSGSRKRWWVRYHLDEPGFRARSKRAAHLLASAPRDIDMILQVGATFEVDPPPGVPIALYCDSNIEMSRLGAASGASEASALSELEYRRVRRREASVYARADVIFTMSEVLRRSFTEVFGLDPERLVTIHCAPNAPFPLLHAEDWNRPEPPTVLFVGRDFDRKGGRLLLDAFSEVRRRVPDARLQFVGCADAAPPNTPPWVEFHGFQSRDTESGRRAMDLFYRNASVFCLPTRFEPFGTSFVEAMGYGLPCVGPRAWAVPEIIVDGDTGYLIPPDDPDSLAEAISRLLEDRTIATRMGKAGRERALDRFTWPGIAARVSQTLESVTPAGSRGRRATRSP